MNLSRAVFLDKDGTLVEDLPYNIDPALIRFHEGTLACLRALQQAGHQIIVVSNQSGIARGYFKEEDLIPVENHLRRAFCAAGILLSGFYYCPHHPEAEISEYAVKCFCRKPWPGMIYRAAGEHGVDLEASWMLGDILDDIEAGNRARCRTILIDNHHETEWDVRPIRRPDFVVNDLPGAVHAILQESGSAGHAEP
ncbi:MAG: D-glycero-alpha-D-manno-heptose-1,7-bisphosphate 7-phosphatase [Bacteroidota bacterium]